MKNHLLLILSLLLMACSSDTPEDSVSGKTEAVPLGFTAGLAEDVSLSTRADGEDLKGEGEWTTASLRTAGFGVYCWYTGHTDFDEWASGQTHIKDYLGTTGYMLMQNQKVEYDTEKVKWDYTPSKYWPLDLTEKLTLRAYAPYTDNLVLDPMEVADRGTPYLPVTVLADDYCNNCQHDPLWGTSKYMPDGTVDGLLRYGTHYDNYTYKMSGDDKTAEDERDGVIDWYFHHGMAKFGLQAQLLTEEPGVDVRVTGIHTGPFYNFGLLDIFNSPTASSADKPIWRNRTHPVGDDFYVTIGYEHPDASGTHNDLNGVVLNAERYQNVAKNGLLVIPRDYSGATPMLVRVTYTRTNSSTGAVISTGTVDGYVTMDVKGNTVYALQLLIGTDANTLYVRSFVNLYWQTGTYQLLDDL